MSALDVGVQLEQGGCVEVVQSTTGTGSWDRQAASPGHLPP